MYVKIKLMCKKYTYIYYMYVDLRSIANIWQFLKLQLVKTHAWLNNYLASNIFSFSNMPS